MFIKKLASSWANNRTPRMAAALAYYSMFSLAPVLFISLTIAGIFTRNQDTGEVFYVQLEQMLGTDATGLVRQLVFNWANQNGDGSVLSTFIGAVALLYVATGVFAQLKDIMNTVWEVPLADRRGAHIVVKDRLIAFAIVLGVSLLFILASFASLVITILASTFDLDLYVPLANNLVIFSLMTLSFIVLYRILPDTRIDWSDVWLGGLIAAFLFAGGARLIRFYLSRSNFNTAFQAASALAVLLIGINILAQIFLFGAIFTKVYTHHYGSRCKSSEKSINRP
jgi:membrane protein